MSVLNVLQMTKILSWFYVSNKFCNRPLLTIAHYMMIYCTKRYEYWSGSIGAILTYVIGVRFLAKRCNCIASSAVVIICLLSVCLSSVCNTSVLWQNASYSFHQSVAQCLKSLPAKCDDEIRWGSPRSVTQTGVWWFSIDFATLYLGNGAR